MNKKITVIIPARGGSKRLHKKNIAPIWGKPMLCWVIAAAQWGNHGEGRDTWGHSMVIDPWGQIVSSLPSGVGTFIAEIDFSLLDTVRTNMPMEQHTHFHCQ